MSLLAEVALSRYDALNANIAALRLLKQSSLSCVNKLKRYGQKRVYWPCMVNFKDKGFVDLLLSNLSCL